MHEAVRITSVEVYRADLALHEPFRIAVMVTETAPNIFIRVHTDAGFYGMGEASPTWRLCGETQGIDIAAARDLARLLEGRDALAVEERQREMKAYLAHNSTIRSAFDMALYDIAGKAAGLPLYKLLGGERRTLKTDLTIGLGEPDHMARKAEGIRRLGFGAVKVKLGTTREADTARIEAIRSALGPDVPLRIDANQGWSFATAAATLGALEPFSIQYCEQPLPRWDRTGMRELRERTSIPIMADEALFDQHDAFALAAGRCCDYFNIKLAKSGGLRDALGICAVAESAGIPCMVGCMMESRLGLTAAAHLAAARRDILFCDLDSALLLSEDPVIEGIAYEADDVILPEGPGLGADVDPAYLEKADKQVL